MFLLRLTSDPALRGAQTDDGFTIGVFSTETLFLLGVTAGLGILGGLFYLIVRGWIPGHWRVVVMTVYVGLVGGAGLISVRTGSTSTRSRRCRSPSRCSSGSPLLTVR